MARISNSLIGILNLLTLVISFPIVGTGLWFRLHSATECERFLQLPVLVFGLVLMLMSLLGLIGACCGLSFFLSLYLFVTFLLIVGMFVVTVLAFVVTNKGAGEAVSGRGFLEYRLGDYSHWLQRMVADSTNWGKIEGCMKEAKVCGGFHDGEVINAAEFYRKNLSPIQSGCCKPPTYCGFKYKNATYWTIPKSGLASIDADCKAWSNDQQRLCYGCNSCKAGVLANLKNEWKKVSIFNVSLLVFLVIVYSIGCCAYRNNRADNKYRRYRGGYH